MKKNIFFATLSCTRIFRNCGNLDLFSSKSVELSFIWLSEDQGLLPLYESIEAKSYLIGGKISKSVLSKVEWVDASIGLQDIFFFSPWFSKTPDRCAPWSDRHLNSRSQNGDSEEMVTVLMQARNPPPPRRTRTPCWTSPWTPPRTPSSRGVPGWTPPSGWLSTTTPSSSPSNSITDWPGVIWSAFYTKFSFQVSPSPGKINQSTHFVSNVHQHVRALFSFVLWSKFWGDINRYLCLPVTSQHSSLNFLCVLEASTEQVDSAECRWRWLKFAGGLKLCKYYEMAVMWLLLIPFCWVSFF